MKVSGFTFVKDAVKYDFPLVESLKSMMPLCDEIFVNVGVSEDDTLEIVKSIKDSKIKIIETEWDEKFKYKKRILSQQTNIPLYKCRGDWCLYLQADEVLHEKDYDMIISCMEENLDNKRVQGILFDYYHLYGSYDTYVRSFHWYRKEIRIIRNRLGIQSWKDAQGFRADGKKLRVKACPAHVYHYGWVRDPHKMEIKKRYQRILYHGGNDNTDLPDGRFYYEKDIDPHMVSEFNESHPAVMKERIDKWKYKFEPEKFSYKPSLKDIRCRVTDFIDRVTGLKIGEYRNYRVI